MARFTPTFLDEIRDRVPISAVVGTRVSWDRKKTNAAKGDWWACCPFHGEKSPSFHAEDRKGRYHCFGCGVSGDHFRFMVELEGLSFPEAVERVAEMAGVALPARDPEVEKRERERASLTDVMEMAAKFFQEKLQAPEGAKARAYLRERALSSATQSQFRLGYAPESRNALKEHLAAKGVPKGDIEACGLVRHGDDIPVSYDWFRDRIMFPIEDRQGRTIAFGGRAMSADIPAKYINSPDTELFHKGNVLFNFARARKAMGKDDTIIAVEGYMDAIALSQAGFRNVVAPLGTALTENQLELLWRMNGEPVLCFDGDQAGLRAAWRAADLALPVIQPGRTLRFALLPSGKDPDDLVREQGAEAFGTVLSEARPLADLIWLRETSGTSFDTPERRAELEKTLRDITGRIRDENLRRHYQQDMRDRVNAFFGATRVRPEPWRKDKGGRPAQGGAFAKPGAAPRAAMTESLGRSAMVRRAGDAMTVREATLIVALVNHPRLIDDYFEQVEWLDFASPELRRLHGVILDVLAHEPTPEQSGIMQAIDRAGGLEIWARAVMLVQRTRQWPALAAAAIEDARDAFAQALALQRNRGTLHKELKSAETALATDPTDENYQHMLDIKAQFVEHEATEALIDGFGALSGRAGRA